MTRFGAKGVQLDRVSSGYFDVDEVPATTSADVIIAAYKGRQGC